jgi:DNA-binding transcriptional LysR family regulator
MDFKIQILRYCIAVAEAGSFHGAARQFKRSQPALSSAIRDFEDKLGQPLFEKGGKPKLTMFGQFCLPKFKKLIRSHDQLSNQIELFAAGEHGEFSLAAVPSVASRLLPIWLSEFIARFPDLRMNAIDATTETVCKMVVEEEVELGIGSMLEPDERLHFYPLSHDRLGVVCHRQHRLAEQAELHWKQLLGQGLIVNTTMESLKATHAAPLLADSSVSIHNIYSLLAMVRQLHGVTILPETAFPSNDPDLVFIPLADPYIQRSVGLITRAGRVLSPSAAQFVQYMIHFFSTLEPAPEPI